MDKRLRINFCWQGITGRYGQWKDGLYAAMKLIEKDHDVAYYEPSQQMREADVLLYWEAPCTAQGKDAENYNNVRSLLIPKILLFAGGPIRPADCSGFDLFLVESKINEEEFEGLGLPWLRAFGVNSDVIRPQSQPKIWDACMPATCASWKRQGLFSKAMRGSGVLCGRDQETDPSGFMEARKYKTTLFPELAYEAVNVIYNASHCCLNTSEFWGGGQRATLEALAAGIPAVVMSDSPKNREYIEESGCGTICEPTVEAIQKAVFEVKTWDRKQTEERCRRYIESKWTPRHYADAILKGINQVLYGKS